MTKMERMHKFLLFLLALSGSLLMCHGQENVPTIRVLPEDVVQDSVQKNRMGTNIFVVRWKWTEEGAKKMLAFEEAHEGKITCTLFGDYRSIAARAPGPDYYTEWKEGWLKTRTTKIVSLTENEADKIVAGLKGK
jgi:hypothetical protein